MRFGSCSYTQCTGHHFRNFPGAWSSVMQATNTSIHQRIAAAKQRCEAAEFELERAPRDEGLKLAAYEAGSDYAAVLTEYINSREVQQ